MKYGFIDLEKTRLKLDRRFFPIKNLREVIELGVKRGDTIKLRWEGYSIRFLVDSVYVRKDTLFINLGRIDV